MARVRTSQSPPARPNDRQRRWEVAVIGGGITGLSAAWALSADDDTVVTLFEGSEHLGGKLAGTELVGVNLDVGAESMLAARPEATRLAGEVGLKPAIVHPESRSVCVFARGQLRPIPTGLVTGVPTNLRALAASGIISVPGLLRIPVDQVKRRTEVGSDISVGDYITARIGREVVERLADPLLAGVYAGNADHLSLRMANPSLFRQIQSDSSLLLAASRVHSGGAQNAGARRGPAFAGIRGGIARLAAKTASSLQTHGVTTHTGDPVLRLRRLRNRWVVATASIEREFDAVVMAAPADVAADLLRVSAPFTAMQLRSIEYSSQAVVTLAYPVAAMPPVKGTGFFIPPFKGYHVKGVTYTSNKWEWVASDARGTSPGGAFIVRASVGRFGDDAVLERDDAEIVRLVRAELTSIAGLPPVTIDHRVTRWPNSIPQYHVGHVDLVERAKRALADVPGLALAGAAYDGVGVASCIASGRRAAMDVIRHLDESSEQAHG